MKNRKNSDLAGKKSALFATVSNNLIEHCDFLQHLFAKSCVTIISGRKLLQYLS